MKSHIWRIILLSTLTHSAVADTIESRFPIEEELDGVSTFVMRGDAKMLVEQTGDTTTLKSKGQAVATITAPQFVRKIIKSPDKRFALVLIDTDRSSGNLVASNYHSILRLEFSKNGAFVKSERFLAKTTKMMKELNRWVVKIDSVLNDGRTVRLHFGEQRSKDDPSMEMRYAWQIRDIATGKLYRDEAKTDPDQR